MAMFGSMGRAAAALPYEELLRRQRMGQTPIGVPSDPNATMMAPTPGVGGGLPASAAQHSPSGMFASGARGKGGDGFDWKAAMITFANPDAGATYVKRRDQQAKEAASQAAHIALLKNLMDRGISAADAELYAINPEKLSEELNTRFRTREASEGETIRTPGMGSQPEQVWTAPKTFNNGPDVVRFDPQSGTAAPIYQGKTDAQRALEESGYQPGTPEAFRFMRDLHLDGQGPTAVDMQRAQLGQSDLNNRRSTGVSERNSIRSSATSRYNAGNTPLTPVINQNGDVAFPFRNGQVRSVPGSRPISGPHRGGAGTSGGTRIRNPQTGETMVLKNGQWVRE